MLTNNEEIKNGMVNLSTNRKSVPHQLLVDVHDFVDGATHFLDSNCTYKLKVLYGPKLWKSYNRRTKINAGYVMSHLVATGQIPMVYAGKGSNSKRYKIM